MPSDATIAGRTFDKTVAFSRHKTICVPYRGVDFPFECTGRLGIDELSGEVTSRSVKVPESVASARELADTTSVRFARTAGRPTSRRRRLATVAHDVGRTAANVRHSAAHSRRVPGAQNSLSRTRNARRFASVRREVWHPDDWPPFEIYRFSRYRDTRDGRALMRGDTLRTFRCIDAFVIISSVRRRVFLLISRMHDISPLINAIIIRKLTSSLIFHYPLRRLGYTLDI